MAEENENIGIKNDEMISMDEHKRRTDAAITARFKKQAEDSVAAEEVKRQRDAALLELNAIKSNSIESPETASHDTGLSADDIHAMVENDLRRHQKQGQVDTENDNIQKLLSKGYKEDPELKELVMDTNKHGIPGEAVHAILSNLGEKGLPAIKNALKNEDSNAELMGLLDNPAKMVAWASKFNNSPKTKENGFPVMPDISEASGATEEDDTKSLVKNARV